MLKLTTEILKNAGARIEKMSPYQKEKMLRRIIGQDIHGISNKLSHDLLLKFIALAPVINQHQLMASAILAHMETPNDQTDDAERYMVALFATITDRIKGMADAAMFIQAALDIEAEKERN